MPQDHVCFDGKKLVLAILNRYKAFFFPPNQKTLSLKGIFSSGPLHMKGKYCQKILRSLIFIPCGLINTICQEVTP